MRVRVATLATGLSLGALLTVYISWRCGDWALDRFLFTNRSFNIEQIDIQTDGVISLEELRRWAGVKRNQNIFALDLHRVKRDLELVPAIQSVSVERVLPRTLRIRVTEREPVAQLQDYLVDTTGFIMRPLLPQQRAVAAQPGEHYPVIAGVSPSEVRVGREIDIPQVRAALRLIGAFDRSPMAPIVDIARIDVSQPDVLQVFTAQQNEVTFAIGDFDRQFNRWWLVHEHGNQASRQIGWLDLSVGENIPLRWLDAAAVPPSAPKLHKHSPYKKRHV